MNHFLRALKEAWRHWFVLATALVFSIFAAALWGANIAAMFPIIETTLHGRSIPEGNRQKVVDAQQDIAGYEAHITRLTAELPQVPPEPRKQKRREIENLKERILSAQRTIQWANDWQAFFDQWFPAQPFATVLLIVCVIAVATALKQTLGVSSHMMVSYVSQSIARSIRLRIFDKALTLDRPGFNQLGTSGFAANITHTTEMLATGITAFYHGAFSEPCRILACLAGAFCISWRLTLVSLIFAPLIAYLMLGLNRRIRGLSTRHLQRSLGFHHVMLEVFHAIVTVQAYTMEDFERERFAKSTKDLRRAALLANFYNTLTNPLTEVFGVAMLCTALAASAYLVINRETHIFGIPLADEPPSIGTIMVFVAMFIGAADPLRKLSAVITGVNNGMAASGILYPILDMQPKVLEPVQPKQLPKRHQCIEFRNIGFSYDGEHYVLKDVNLKVEFGEHLAIVGPNGGGKSTLMNLLCRFFDPQQGEVLIDGISIRDVPLKDLRSRISLVTQQTELFNESILHNIRYGRWDATEDEIFEAARRAKAHEFITGFAEGYHTIVGPNGQRLSGGQRQRIALARAILRNAEILVLDEATSQIDRESEQLIHDALAELGKERTMIMITHRESTLSLATKIVQIQHGVLTPLPLAKAA
ncbi:MAG: ABC transporter ATP-binding protein [Pirellulaceae bacterium]|nr:ABC transporter ATP-binding protein [Pirellulaceae bacterium]